MEKLRDSLIIYNPMSTGFNKEKLVDIVSVLRENDIKPYVEKSKYPGHVIDLVKNHDQEQRLIITLGGDGTVNEAYTALNDINQKGVYTHIASGTANDMAKNYDIAKKASTIDIMEDILHGEVKTFDTYSVNGKIAAYTSVFGHLAHIPFVTPNSLKQTLGYAGYIVKGLKDLMKKPIKYNISYETDNLKGNDSFILGSISNSKGFAGVNLFKDAKLDDGKIELLLIKDLDAKLIAELFVHFLRNDIDLEKYKEHLVFDKTSEIKLTFNENFPNYSVDIDGEDSKIRPNYKDKDLIFKIEKPVRVMKRKQGK